MAQSASKRKRHTAILEFIRARRAYSQDELRPLLRERGFDVTQATFSRDLRELREHAVPAGGGRWLAGLTGSILLETSTRRQGWDGQRQCLLSLPLSPRLGVPVASPAGDKNSEANLRYRFHA